MALCGPNGPGPAAQHCWWVEGTTVLRAGNPVRLNYGPSLERLGPGDRVGVTRGGDGTLRLVVNGEEAGPGCPGVPAGVRAVFWLAGAAAALTVTSVRRLGGAGEEGSNTGQLQSGAENWATGGKELTKSKYKIN